MNRKHLAILPLSLLIFLVAFSIGYTLNPLNNHRDPQVSANVYIFKETTTGKDLVSSGNVITNIGERMIRNLIGFNNESNYLCNYISLGNATVGQTLTQLTTEATTTGFDRQTGAVVAWINSADYAFNVTKKFTATGDINVNAAGLHWVATDDTDNNMFACASLGGAQAFENNWNCTIVWSITWNAN